MASKKKKSKQRARRPDKEFFDAAKRLSVFAPSLAKYETIDRALKPSERGAIARKEKLLRYTDHLVPISKKLAKKLGKAAWTPIIKDIHGHNVPSGKKQGIYAVQLSNTGRDTTATLAVSNDGDIISIDDMLVKSNGRAWVYKNIDMPITDREKAQFRKELRTTAKEAYQNPQQMFDIEKIVELARKTLENPKTKEIYLWTRHGRVGGGHKTFPEFLQWMQRRYAQYSNDPAEWIYGIAVMIGDGK